MAFTIPHAPLERAQLTPNAFTLIRFELGYFLDISVHCSETQHNKVESRGKVFTFKANNNIAFEGDVSGVE